jgi:ribosomal 50S subunit-recycling heat shock protein
MKKLIVVLAASLLALSLGSLSFGAEEKQSAEPKKSATEKKKPSVKKEKTTHVQATVESIDLDKRLVTLKGPNGDLFDIVAGERVKNLPQVKVGDIVDITYYESIAVKVYKPGEMPQGDSATVGAERLAKPGEKPAGVAGSKVTITATVESISPKKTSVTLKMSDGKMKVVKVEDKKNLENVKVGDEVMITVTEALAIQVKPAAKK